MGGGGVTLAAVFAKLSPAEARACYDALAQWAENELTRDDLEDDVEPSEAAVAVGAVVERLDAAMAELAG